MTPAFREASRDDVEAIAALLSDDVLGKRREARDLDRYRAAFDAMAAEPNNTLIVGEAEGRIVAVYQITFISGLSRGGARRAQIEAVRVAADARGRGLGEALMRDAEARARAEGCALVQLTTDRARVRAHRFYDRLGYVASHFGYKRALDS
ncbi:MAG: GNAT family N-acetyltransferase [Pseudomonadota bacterium]